MKTKTNHTKATASMKSSWRFRIPAILGLLPLLLLALPAMLEAQTFTNSYGVWSYLTDGANAVVTGFAGTNEVVTIPDMVNGLPVVGIGTNAFAGSSLTSVTIPDSVVSIGDSAFNLCLSLANVVLGNGVTRIGDYAFSGVHGNGDPINTITIPDSVTNIGVGAFGLTRLTNAIIGTNVISIGDSAFEGTSLPTVAIPGSVTSIGDYAFTRCLSLTNVTILNSPASVGYAAFDGCSKLRNVTLGNGVTSIGDDAFSGTQSALPGDPISTITIPNSVTNLGVDAFYDCENLTNVTIGDGVTSIRTEVFAWCHSLTSVTIPTSVTSVGTNAFFECGSLTNVTFMNSPVNIRDGAFGNCSILDTVELGNRVTSIGAGAFGFDGPIYSPFLGAITIPNSVTNIGDHAFANRIGLTNVTILNSPATIELGAFLNCFRLTTVMLGTNLTSIGDYAFADPNIPGGGWLTTITIPASVTNIGFEAFYYCPSLAGAYFLGNAPPDNGTAFDLDSLATVYYLPGTTGWGPTFGGGPTVLWNPQAQELSMTAGQFGFNITGPTNAVIVVEAATNLANPMWIPVGTNTLTDGSSPFSDADWTNFPGRYYRLRSPQ